MNLKFFIQNQRIKRRTKIIWKVRVKMMMMMKMNKDSAKMMILMMMMMSNRMLIKMSKKEKRMKKENWIMRKMMKIWTMKMI